MRYTRVAIAAVILASMLLPAATAATAGEPQIVLMYAFPPEGTLLRFRMARVTVADEVMGSVAKGELDGVPVALAPSGVGMTNAALATQRIIDRYRPRWMIFSGIAGGVEPETQIGDIIVAEKCATHQFGYVGKVGFEPRMIALKGERFAVSAGPPAVRYFPADAQLLRVAMAAASVIRTQLKPVLERMPSVSVGGVCVSGDQFVDQVELREYLFKTFQARIVDMETSAFLQVCAANRVSCVAVRSSSDLAGGSGSATASSEIGQFFQVAADNSAAMTMAMLRFMRMWGMTQ
jgi:adenosylhomocysteine nucleosidase